MTTPSPGLPTIFGRNFLREKTFGLRSRRLEVRILSPNDKAAAFRDLRARGAFLVSAERIPGKHLHAKIHSLRGNRCRLRWTAEEFPKISRNGEPVKFTIEGRDLLFDTQEGAVYEIEGGD